MPATQVLFCVLLSRITPKAKDAAGAQTDNYILRIHNKTIDGSVWSYDNILMVDRLVHNSFESRRISQRDLIDVLRTRVDLLAGEDRALMEMYLDGGRNFNQIAQLTGSNPSTIARRLRRITQRLTDETFFCCLRYRRRLGRKELAIIRDHFIRGLSIGQISTSRNISLYRVRRVIRRALRITASMSRGMPL
jgi:DNA-directed RNA polymerase specialized sigma24 family protein